MPRPWKLLDSVDTAEGPLELRQRSDSDFLISIRGRVLMSSMIHRSELTVAQWGCEHLREHAAPRVLIGGLGLGYTLRAALDALPSSARVVVAELNPRVVDWCRGPAAACSGNALADPRVEVAVGDVTDRIREAARASQRARFDSVIFDLYEGPGTDSSDADPLYGRAILRHIAQCLRPGGIHAVWGEAQSPRYEARLKKAGFRPEMRRVRGGGVRHAVYLCSRPG